MLVGDEVRPYWAADGAGMAYRLETGAGCHRFFRVDLASGVKAPAFDHEALAAALSAARNGEKISADALPIDQLEVGDAAVSFEAYGQVWRFEKASGVLEPGGVIKGEKVLVAPEELPRWSRDENVRTSVTLENATPEAVEMWWVAGGGHRKSYGKIESGKSRKISTYAGHSWLITDAKGEPLAGLVAKEHSLWARVTGRVAATEKPEPAADVSPDGRWRAVIRDHNLMLEPVAGGDAVPLAHNGSAANFFSGPFHWSPDSTRLVAFRAKDVTARKVHIVKSSPKDQVQPELVTFTYSKPADELPQPKPRLFDVPGQREIALDDALFANPWSIDNGAWNEDSSEFSFVYNQRGHQVMRLIALRADSGSARVIIEETSPTFIDYSQKFYLRRLSGGEGLLWASERSGYNHLYRFDPQSGGLRNAVTHGEWNVREVVEVDEKSRRLLLKVVGMPGTSPYFQHFVRVNWDGSGFTRLTEGDGCHKIAFSPCGKWLLDTWSRVDLPPVTELRDAESGRLVCEIARADDSALRATGWSRPERFVAKGRDGQTDIHGIIIRPTHFDSAKSYPVVESIYAGPHGHFVPQCFMAWSRLNAMAELGFVVVQIDGMGTNWRSKKFHDVCWKNLKDAGFPDRIPWIRAAAASRPWMDLKRVGIYGGSAGGQNALSALLHHGDFYQVAVADCGCHDNRMDKIWWNEAWMGWPVDESYKENSNVTHAPKLRGKLLLIVGELDHNVDPASTYQVVGALQKAGKHFEFMPIINTGHSAAESPYGDYRRAEFLVRELGAELR